MSPLWLLSVYEPPNRLSGCVSVGTCWGICVGPLVVCVCGQVCGHSVSTLLRAIVRPCVGVCMGGWWECWWCVCVCFSFLWFRDGFVLFDIQHGNCYHANRTQQRHHSPQNLRLQHVYILACTICMIKKHHHAQHITLKQPSIIFPFPPTYIPESGRHGNTVSLVTATSFSPRQRPPAPGGSLGVRSGICNNGAHLFNPVLLFTLEWNTFSRDETFLPPMNLPFAKHKDGSRCPWAAFGHSL